MNREPTLLPALEPPTGGLTRLRAKRTAMERWLNAGPTRRLAYISALAGGVFAVVLLRPGGQFASDALPATHAVDRLLGVRSQGDSLRAVDASTIVQQLPSQQPGVRLYWTEYLTPSEPAAQE